MLPLLVTAQNWLHPLKFRRTSNDLEFARPLALTLLVMLPSRICHSALSSSSPASLMCACFEVTFRPAGSMLKLSFSQNHVKMLPGLMGTAPITLLSGLGKSYERVTLARLKLFMELLPPKQFGFRQKLSTAKQLVHWLSSAEVLSTTSKALPSIWTWPKCSTASGMSGLSTSLSSFNSTGK
ncbi:hypothetical protein X975_01589, partial [Stegodyphus mimosarum]